MSNQKLFLGDNKKMQNYYKTYRDSITNKDKFWQDKSNMLDWLKPFSKTSSGSFQNGDIRWFLNGKLNACLNCVDRHLPKKGSHTAIVWEGDDGETREISFLQLHQQVCKLTNCLRRFGVKKGDVVCIYMPMVPEAAFAMLACARIGAPHSVVFAGFSSSALGDRLKDCGCKVVITAEKGFRGGRMYDFKSFAEEAVQNSENQVQRIFVFQRHNSSQSPPEDSGKVIWLPRALENEAAISPVEEMDSEDPLFLLYTSGSTGKPKGLVHTTGGYLVYAAFSLKTVFAVEENDIFGCVADIGWITGHTYVIYGPLLNGVSTLMFESTPLHPDASRYWTTAEKHRLTQFYTSPTAIRALQRHGDSFAQKSDLSRLRVIGSVGEPLNKAAWDWYFHVVGRGATPLVDTYWQTETGGIVVSPLPGVTPLKPGSAAFPLFGVEVAVLDPATGGEVAPGAKGVLCLKSPVPGMARSILGNHKAYLETYMEKYKGYYYSGDGATRDEEGYLHITGRVDDVISIAGHRLGTAEIESAITKLPSIVECAVVAVADDVKGQKWLAFAIQKEGGGATLREILGSVREHVGPFAASGQVVFVGDLPKTRSGKIMRRALRKIASSEADNLGDVSTLTNPSCVREIAEMVKAQLGL